ncbi:hypothetical protein FRC10_006121 [Ceratobasidium sp. 414]|nr:hypothetical protein FRC10_006121 [Ceratobasidium sp. 414]
MDSLAPQRIISSGARDNRFNSLDPRQHPSRFKDIVAGIARTGKMMIMCGDVALAGTGIQSLDTTTPVKYEAESRQVTLRALLKECSPAQVRPEELPANKLAAYSRAMAERRVASRHAGSNRFLDFLVRVLEEGRLVECMTTSFDGLEAGLRSDLAEKVVMLYGDNRRLRCCTRLCRGIPEEGTKALDRDLTSGSLVICPGCDQRNKKASKARRAGNDATRSLRPAVQCSLGEAMASGEERARLQKAAESCQLLLIVGAPPKSSELLQLTRDLSAAVHEKYGAVVYIDAEPLQGRHIYDHIDLHLQLDVQEAVSHVMDKMQAGLSLETDEGAYEAGDTDFWFDMINNELSRQRLPDFVPYLGPTCENCCCGVPEYLAECTVCSVRFCHRRVEPETAESADSANLFSHRFRRTALNGTSKEAGSAHEGSEQDGSDQEGEDTFPFEEACLAFHAFEEETSRPSVEDSKRKFVCPKCWDHRSMGLYPHYLRPVPREKLESPDQPWPRLAFLVYYVEQFWPQTKHLCTLVAGTWKQMGWQCIIEPVKLEHLEEKRTLFVDL